ncbi:hypothetical protein [Roseateles puraquae]|uniref:Uncharacterized protein n=1 Tax=Roseateles puraquae TaxID=431059 RepID=A0A254MXE5_9BURK|nr:hypothetical protein [Roseateles puraquae]OWQ96478.1 hypothetical protein CDO81_27225 [Roseateles puraquae]
MTSRNYAQPLDPDVARQVSQLDDEAEREAFEERAAVFEYDGGLPRREAERLALAAVLADRAKANQPPR